MRCIALEYHDVIAGADFDVSGFPGPSAASYKMDATRFDAHVRALAPFVARRCNDVRDVSASPGVGTPVCLTFDDGGRSALHEIADCLERHGWRGHFFVTTAQLGAPTFLSRAEVRELSTRGHVIGSHSHAHPTRFARLTPQAQREEWRRSREELESAIGRAVTVASVPGGYYDRAVAAGAAESGIRWLFTSEPVTTVESVAECAVVGRFTLRRESPAALAASLAGPAPWARGRQWLDWNARKLAKALLGETYLRLRASVLGDSRRP